MQNTLEIINNYIPYNEQEQLDKQNILLACQHYSDLLYRTNPFFHFTASAFVVNKGKNKVLCCFHNIYKSWSWLGGHMDGTDSPMDVAQKEAKEETNITCLTPLSNTPISIDILCTEGHIKNQKWISAHVHYNICYLFVADEHQPISKKPDENSAVSWLTFDELLSKVREPQMKLVYSKIIKKIKDIK